MEGIQSSASARATPPTPEEFKELWNERHQQRHFMFMERRLNVGHSPRVRPYRELTLVAAHDDKVVRVKVFVLLRQSPDHYGEDDAVVSSGLSSQRESQVTNAAQIASARRVFTLHHQMKDNIPSSRTFYGFVHEGYLGTPDYAEYLTQSQLRWFSPTCPCGREPRLIHKGLKCPTESRIQLEVSTAPRVGY